MRKVLLVSYHFPPDGAIGAHRAARFARALPDHGWSPFVLTAREDACQTRDPEWLADMVEPRVKVVRTGELPKLMTLYRRWRARGNASDANAPMPKRPGTSAPDEALSQRVRRWVISLIVCLLDDKKGWAAAASVRALRLVRAERIDCVLTSGPPVSAHLAGLLAKVLTDVNWVADFRDPWVESLDGRPAHARSLAADAIEHRFERLVVTKADRVITTTEAIGHALERRYPLCRGKVVCIPNGIDPIAPEPGEEKFEVFTITYAGSLYEGRSPEPLFRAIGALIRDRRIQPSQIAVKLVGSCATVDGIDTRTIARKHGVDSRVEIQGFLPRREALRLMRRSHLLLAISPPHHELIVPAKLYDYLASGTPILLLSEGGAAVDFVRETAAGASFSQADTAPLREHLYRAIVAGSAPAADRTPWLARYDAGRLTSRLATELSALSGQAMPAVEAVRG